MFLDKFVRRDPQMIDDDRYKIGSIESYLCAIFLV